ncbi:hypothetical protein ABIE44_000575 [Marmoricola sp. OAE513]|uniref:hypothetical protein n=1 Tax=Marmoricola sp. OAE513 TaxID=2817894 RepID=UPI001AEB8B85
MDYARAHYDDGSVACDESGLAIQRYYPWGARRIQYGEIKDVSVLPLSGWAAVQPWHLWGPTDLEHWWNLDPHRPERKVALVIDTGERFKPTVTPCDPDGFELVVRAHLNGLPQLRETAALARLMVGYRPPIPTQRAGRQRGQRAVDAMVPEPTTRVPS